MRPYDPTDRPLVAFVIATLDARARLQQCLDSIRAQTDGDWEIIVIDGGSRDGTAELIAANAGSLAFWCSEPDRGIYDAWNKALPHVRARWVNFLGADDHLFDERVVERLRPTLERLNPSHRIVYGRVAGISESGAFVEYFGRPWDRLARLFPRGMCIPHQGVFHRRELFDAGARFDRSFRLAGDYEFLLRELKHRPPVYCDLCVAAWRDGGLTSGAATALAVLKEFRRAQRLNGLPAPTPWMAMARAAVKQFIDRRFSPFLSRLMIDAYRVLTRRPPKFHGLGGAPVAGSVRPAASGRLMSAR